jgi:hypothetical protein
MQVKFVVITIQNPTPSNPTGEVEDGWYVESDGAVTLTTRNGTPLHDRRGKQYSAKLKPGDDPRSIAGKLTREWTSAKRRGSSFSRPLRYQNLGIV